MHLKINIENLNLFFTTNHGQSLTEEEKEAINKLSHYISRIRDISFEDATGKSVIVISKENGFLKFDFDDNFII